MLPSALLSKLRANKPKIAKNKSTNIEKRTKPSKKSTKSKLLSIKDEISPEILELESTFRVKTAVVSKAIQGLITLTTSSPELKKKLFDDEQFPLFLQINSIKVAQGHSRIVRFSLKYSLFNEDSEVCLIVPDVKGIANKKHDEHLEHYEKLLSQKGVKCIKKIMTFHEFRTEYETFELKNRLVELYDAFLVDGRISGKTVKKCGKIFYKKRKIPTAVKLQSTKLKEHIEKTLQKTSLYLHGKSDSFVVQIGHSKMSNKELVENLFFILKGIDKEFPGGFGNIRNLNLFTVKGITFPIYTTLKNKNQVALPKIIKTEKGIEEFTGELSTKLNSGVVVKATGEVTTFPLDKNKTAEEDEEIEEEPPNKKKRKVENKIQVKKNTAKEKKVVTKPTKPKKKKQKILN